MNNREESSPIKERIESADNPDTPAHVLDALAKDPYTAVRYWVARNRNTSPQTLDYLARDSDRGVRMGVARNPSASLETLARLANDPSESVRYQIVENRNIPAELLARLAESSDRYMRFLVARKHKTPPETLSRLARDPDKNIRKEVASNSKTPTEVLIRLASDPDTEVRKNVASNSYTPIEALDRLAGDPCELVRGCVATNFNTPGEILARLAYDSDEWVREFVARNPSTPPETLVHLAYDPNSRVRRGVAGNLSTPPEILVRLSEEKSSDMRGAIADNPNTPFEALVKITRVVNVTLRRGRRTKAIQTGVPGTGAVTIFTSGGLKVRPIHPGLLPRRIEDMAGIAHERGIIAVKGFSGTPTNGTVSESRLEQLILAVQLATPEIPQPLMIPIKSEGVEFIEEPAHVLVTSRGEQLPEELISKVKPLGTVRLVTLVTPFSVFNNQTGLLSYRLKDTNLIRFVFSDPVPVTPEIEQKLEGVPKLKFNGRPQSGVPHVEMGETYIYALWYPFEVWEYEVV